MKIKKIDFEELLMFFVSGKINAKEFGYAIFKLRCLIDLKIVEYSPLEELVLSILYSNWSQYVDDKELRISLNKEQGNKLEYLDQEQLRLRAKVALLKLENTKKYKIESLKSNSEITKRIFLIIHEFILNKISSKEFEKRYYYLWNYIHSNNIIINTKFNKLIDMFARELYDFISDSYLRTKLNKTSIHEKYYYNPAILKKKVRSLLLQLSKLQISL